MKINKRVRDVAPYALAGMAAAAGWVIWSKSRLSIPVGARAVAPFDLAGYMGKWYEIARYDYRFERGLENVTAFYAQNPDGTVSVTNSGQNNQTGEWRESIGKAKFNCDDNTGRLKVSFFGPFYAAYNIIAIDDNYQHALVAGPDLSYLWLLSRRPVMPDEVRNEFLQVANSVGYDVGRLIWTRHDLGLDDW